MKKSCANPKRSLFTPLLLLLLGFTACYEPVEGCLDVYAENYEANADEQCPDDPGCCNYPELRLTLNQVWGDTTFSYDSVFFSNGSPDSLRMVQVIYYLSEVSLSGPDGDLQIIDRVSADLGSGITEAITDDFIIVDFINGRQYVWGEFQTAGTYDSLHLRLGLAPALTSAVPSSLPDNHELSLQSDTLWQADIGYGLGRVSLVSQANNDDTLTYTIPALNNGLALSFPLDTVINFGVSTSVDLEADYQKLLEGIDFVANGGDEALVIAEIVRNLPNLLSVGE